MVNHKPKKLEKKLNVYMFLFVQTNHCCLCIKGSCEHFLSRCTLICNNFSVFPHNRVHYNTTFAILGRTEWSSLAEILNAIIIVSWYQINSFANCKERGKKTHYYSSCNRFFYFVLNQPIHKPETYELKKAYHYILNQPLLKPGLRTQEGLSLFPQSIFTQTWDLQTQEGLSLCAQSTFTQARDLRNYTLNWKSPIPTRLETFIERSRKQLTVKLECCGSCVLYFIDSLRLPMIILIFW